MTGTLRCGCVYIYIHMMCVCIYKARFVMIEDGLTFKHHNVLPFLKGGHEPDAPSIDLPRRLGLDHSCQFADASLCLSSGCSLLESFGHHCFCLLSVGKAADSTCPRIPISIHSTIDFCRLLRFENCRLCNAELCVLRIDVNCAKPYTCLGYLA